MGEARRKRMVVDARRDSTQLITATLTIPLANTKYFLDELGRWTLEAKKYLTDKNIELVDIVMTSNTSADKIVITISMYVKEKPMVIDPAEAGVISLNNKRGLLYNA
jgi:hypothetical protein